MQPRDAEGFGDAEALVSEVWREFFAPPPAAWPSLAPHCLAELRAELPRLVREAVLEALAAHNPLTQPQQRAVVALAEVFGTSAFTSAEAADELHVDLDTTTRRAYRAALQALCRGQAATPQRIGHALRVVVAAGGQAGAWKLTDDGAEAGSRRWRIEGAASL